MFEYRFLLFTILTTFSLIMLGGFVHNTESSLACPDWPWCNVLCKGKVLAAEDEAVGIERRHQIEMGHRLLASIVGMFTVSFFLLVVIRKRFTPNITLLGFVAVFLVLLQGGLGALTVKYSLPTIISTSHMAVAELFFCLLLFIFYKIKLSPTEGMTKREDVRPLAFFIKIVVFCLYLQILLGGYMRHSGSGLSAGYGPTAAFVGIDTVTGEHSLWPTLFNAKINMLHRYFAVIVTVLVIVAGVKLIRIGEEWPIFKLYAWLAIVAVLFQVFLGILSIWYYLHITVLTLHLGVGTFCFGIMAGAFFHLKFFVAPWNHHNIS